jgi:hypothetical protein
VPSEAQQQRLPEGHRAQDTGWSESKQKCCTTLFYGRSDQVLFYTEQPTFFMVDSIIGMVESKLDYFYLHLALFLAIEKYK